MICQRERAARSVPAYETCEAEASRRVCSSPIMPPICAGDMAMPQMTPRAMARCLGLARGRFQKWCDQLSICTGDWLSTIKDGRPVMARCLGLAGPAIFVRFHCRISASAGQRLVEADATEFRINSPNSVFWGNSVAKPGCVPFLLLSLYDNFDALKMEGLGWACGLLQEGG